jgi:sec-independent protein translocase protein TatC
LALDQQGTGGEMPFLEHLEELRWRIVKSVGAIAISFFASFSVVYAYRNEAVNFLIQPILPLLPDGKLHYTDIFEPFSILMQVSGVLAIVLASPVVGYQIWSFLSPALHERERKVIMPVLSFAAVLFLAGVAMASVIFVPMSAKMMVLMQSDSLAPMITAQGYFGTMFFICLAFGALFELPILILVLTALGLVTPSGLSKFRRHMLVISLIVCEIITPGDFIVTTLMLWIPVYGLYELSIIVSWFMHRRRLKREAAAEQIGAGAAA